jgi:hypothetical protein
LRAYRKEAERLLVWCTRALGKPISSLTREDRNSPTTAILAPRVGAQQHPT